MGSTDGEETGGVEECMSFRHRRVYTWKEGGEGMDVVIEIGTGNGISWGSNDGLLDWVEKYSWVSKNATSTDKMFT